MSIAAGSRLHPAGCLNSISFGDDASNLVSKMWRPVDHRSIVQHSAIRLSLGSRRESFDGALNRLQLFIGWFCLLFSGVAQCGTAGGPSG